MKAEFTFKIWFDGRIFWMKNVEAVGRFLSTYLVVQDAWAWMLGSWELFVFGELEALWKLQE